MEQSTPLLTFGKFFYQENRKKLPFAMAIPFSQIQSPQFSVKNFLINLLVFIHLYLVQQSSKTARVPIRQLMRSIGDFRLMTYISCTYRSR